MTIDYTDSGSSLQATIEAGHWLIDQAVERAISEHASAFAAYMDSEHPRPNSGWGKSNAEMDRERQAGINEGMRRFFDQMAAIQNMNYPRGGLGLIGQQMGQGAARAYASDMAWRLGSGGL